MAAAKPKKKSIIILCDGTSNEIENERTNVVRLYGCLKKNDEQIVWYDPGVGTLGASSGVPKYWRKFKEILGLAFGKGLGENVLEAYEFLSNNYNPGDKIYLFGFSRGAYTVRELASLIFVMGIMPKHQMNLKKYVYDTLSSVNRKEDFKNLGIYQRMLGRNEVPIEFMGLWDTVSSKFDFSSSWFSLKRNPYTTNNPCVKTVAHALAIDERRVMFQQQYWQSDPPVEFRTEIWPKKTAKKPIYQKLNQVWFAGSHCDVGGGFSDDNSQVPKVALEWMLGEAKEAGLKLEANICDLMLGQTSTESGKTYCKPSTSAPLYDSLNGQKFWWLLEVLPQRKNMADASLASFTNATIPLGAARKIIEEQPNVHISVKERIKLDKNYKPKNLPKLDDVNWVSNKPYK